MGDSASVIRVRAFAKINLSLRVLRRRADGYHELRTVLQSIGLHDTLVCTRRRGPLEIACDARGCPVDHTNLVYRAAQAAWNALGRRGRPSGFRVEIEKRIPIQAGLGGGSSDAAAMLRALPLLWQTVPSPAVVHELAAAIGADVPFFLRGGTALGVDRGDLLFPLPPRPLAWVVILLPDFTVSTERAFSWWDQTIGRRVPVAATSTRAAKPAPSGSRLPELPEAEIRNDLERVVSEHHPEIARLIAALRKRGADQSAMSGSGSSVFGLFGSAGEAKSAARGLSNDRCRALVTRTLTRSEYARRAKAQALTDCSGLPDPQAIV